MKEEAGQFEGKDQVGDIWAEAYLDWVEDWTDAYSREKDNPLGCCCLEPAEGRILFPIERI